VQSVVSSVQFLVAAGLSHIIPAVGGLGAYKLLKHVLEFFRHALDDPDRWHRLMYPRKSVADRHQEGLAAPFPRERVEDRRRAR